MATTAKARTALAEQIARLTRESESRETANDEKGKAARDEQLAQLRAIDAVFAQQENRLQQRHELAEQLKAAQDDLESLDKFDPDEPKPYSFLVLEGLHDQSDTEADREKAIRADIKAAKQSLRSAHATLDAAARAAGRAGESQTKANEGSLAVRMARARVGLKQMEVEVDELRLELCQVRQKQLEKKIAVVSQDAKFTEHDRDQQLERLAAATADAKKQRRDAETHLQQVASDEREALAKLAEDKSSPAAIEAAKAAWQVAREVYQSEIVLLDQQLEQIERVRKFWNLRYRVAAGKTSVKERADTLEELDDFTDELQDAARSLQQRRATARIAQSLAAENAANKPDEAVTKWVEFRRSRLIELQNLSEQCLDRIQATERTLDRFRDELTEKIKQDESTWGALGSSVSSILSYKVTTTEDDESVTLGRLLVLLSYVIGGIALAWALSRLIGQRALRRFGVHQGTAAALKSIVFYTLCVVFGILSFQLLNVPLAAFAFLGGAAAIAIGFGGQDIMNNFMSGIILLVEQPIRVGDVVELDSVQGLVMHIGLRSTRLQTDSNHEVIVPNKTLLDEQVTNLTLSDNVVQLVATISLDRSVKVLPAKWKMIEVAFAHPLVLKSPRPIVLITEVDTYWITFEVHFWLQHTTFIKSAMVQSEILETITDLFPEPAEPTESAPSSSESNEPGSAAAMTAELKTQIERAGGAAMAKGMRRAAAMLKGKP